MTGGVSDSEFDDAKAPAVDRRSFLAGSRWASVGEDLTAALRSYVRAAGMRSKVLDEARNWGVAWRSFVEASGGRLGFNQVESDAALKARFRSLYVRTALIKAQELRDDIVLFIASAVVLYGCVTAMVAVVASNVAVAVVAGITALAVLFVVRRLLLALLTVSAGARWPFALVYSLTAAGSVGSAMWLARHWLGYARPFTNVPTVSDARTAFDAGIVIGLAALPISMAGVVLASILGSSVLGRSRLRNHPDVIVFGAFMEILTYLGSRPATLVSLTARRRTAQSFERAARAVEYGLRHALRLSDSRNDVALQRRLHAIASMIRSHQVSFVLSEKVSFVELSNLSARMIRSVCSGALGSLPVPSSQVTPPRSGGRSLLAPLQNVAVALAPVAIVLALVWRRVLSTDAFGRTVVVAAVGWAVISLLTTLDPLLVSRLSTRRDLVSVLRGEVENRQQTAR